MQKFLVLYRSTASAQEQMSHSTPEQGKAVMDEWMAWMKKAGKALVDGGAPLGESAMLKGAAGKGYIGGYSIVQADSIAAAKKLFDSHPHFKAPGASIELLEMMSVPGM